MVERDEEKKDGSSCEELAELDELGVEKDGDSQEWTTQQKKSSGDENPEEAREDRTEGKEKEEQESIEKESKEHGVLSQKGKSSRNKKKKNKKWRPCLNAQK